MASAQKLNGEFRQHGPSHIHESPVLSFSYTILLRGVCSGVLMSYPLITQPIIKCVVLKFRTIVTSNSLDSDIVLTLLLSGEVDEGLLSVTLQFEKEYPTIS